MTSTFLRLGYASGSSGTVPVYANFASLPASPSNGQLGVVSDEDALYMYDSVTATWILIGVKGIVYKVTDSGTIDLTITANDLTASIKNSSITTAMIASPTGTDTNIVTGTKGTSGHFASWDSNGDAIGSGKSVPAGDVVGTSDSQVLTGKTIDGDDNTVQDLALTTLKTVLADANKFIQRDVSGIVVANKAVPTGAVVGTSDTQTITNKTVGDALVFTPVTSPSYTEGKIFYNDTAKTFSFYNNDPDVQLNIGEELWIKSRNSTGTTILNGKAVYVSGATGNRSNISLADSDAANCCEVIGLATHDIENNSDGYVTTFGEVRDIDTSAFTEGDTVYLSTTAGELTNVLPPYPASPIRIGYVLISNPSNGVILVNVEKIQDSNLAPSFCTDTFEPTGFIDRTSSTISVTGATFTLTLTGSTLEYYIKGFKYIISTNKTISITDVEGIHLISLDANGDLVESTVFSMGTFRDNAYIASLYWNATSNEVIYLGEERHGITMDYMTHYHEHMSDGTIYISGGDISGLISEGTGDSNTDLTFALTELHGLDEDIELTLLEKLEASNIYKFYIDNVGAWKRVGADPYPGYSTGSANGRLWWNDISVVGGLAELGNLQFMNVHIVATNDTTMKFIVLLGQASYTTVANARAGVENEINTLRLNGLPFAEFIFLYSIILQTSTTYTSAIKARIRNNTDGTSSLDWRTSKLNSVPTIATGTFLRKEPADINLTSFVMANNVSSATDITGLIFPPASVRSFKAIITVSIDATSDLFESYEMNGIFTGTVWVYTISSTGNDSQVIFTITNAGQVQYTSADISGFASGIITFRALINT